ncbi:MAG: pantoate--beta-alanine ligase [Bacteroidota bacterium]
MQVLQKIYPLREARAALGYQGRVGLVPTMGALHAGHASLAQKSVAENDHTIATVFVNPTQFGPNEDLDRYPRTLDADLALLEDMGVDLVFAPEVKEIYDPAGTEIALTLDRLDKILCGAKRPGHFDGVMQIVSILFNLTQPTHGYFGEKDFQQLTILRQLVKELHFPVEIVGCPIIREEDGLAMSSRNRYLTIEERSQALFLSHCLTYIRTHRDQFSRVSDIQAYIHDQLTHYPLVTLDYAEVFETQGLKPLDQLADAIAPRCFIAAFLGNTRLIDNMAI